MFGVTIRSRQGLKNTLCDIVSLRWHKEEPGKYSLGDASDHGSSVARAELGHRPGPHVELRSVTEKTGFNHAVGQSTTGSSISCNSFEVAKRHRQQTDMWGQDGTSVRDLLAG